MSRVITSPVAWIKRGDYVSSKSNFLVNSGSKRWQEIIIGQKASMGNISHLEFILPEPLEEVFGTGKRHVCLNLNPQGYVEVVKCSWD